MALAPVIAVAWLIGLTLASGAPAATWVGPMALIALAAGAGIAVWGLQPNEITAAPISVTLTLATGALLAGLAVGPKYASEPPLPPAGMARIEAVVERVQHGPEGRARSLVRVLEGERLEDRATITHGTRLWVGPTALPEEARVRLIAKVRPSRPFRNPSPHPPAPSVMPAQGSAWMPNPDAAAVVTHGLVARTADRLRRHVRAALDATLSVRGAGMARALVLGDAAATSEDDLDAVRGSGLTHVIAVSGLHVTILAGVLVALLHRLLLWLPFAARIEMRRIACAAGVPLALGVAVLTGNVPSGWRAAVTAALGWALVALGWRPAPGPVAAMAVILLGALRPHEAAQPGFLLSVVATAAILSMPRVVERTLHAWLVAACSLSWRTTIATAPIILWLFGAVPVVGIAANVLLVPVGSLLLVLAAAHALVASTVPWAAGVSGGVFAALADAFVAGCAVFTRLGPPGPWPPLDVAQGVVVALASAAVLFAPGWKHRIAIALLAGALLAGLEVRLRHVERPRDKLRATFLDVGQGDAALVDLPDGRLMLIDAGGNPGGGADPGARAIVPLLQARRRDRVDVVVLTHPHPDHYGGLRAVLDSVAVGEIWDSGQADAETEIEPSAAEAAGILADARARRIPVRGPADLCGHVVRAGSARIRVLAPCPAHDPGHDPNDNSIVLRIDFGDRSVLFTGDAERHEEDALLTAHAVPRRTGGSPLAASARAVRAAVDAPRSPHPLRADVLKVAHHGSRTSTSAPFLAAVAPRLAVISAGPANRFGHPHAEVVDRLRTGVARIASLAETGGTIVETDGRALHVRTWRGDHWGL
jgi:competence protein ComEC